MPRRGESGETTQIGSTTGLRAVGITCGIGSMLVGSRQAGFDVARLGEDQLGAGREQDPGTKFCPDCEKVKEVRFFWPDRGKVSRICRKCRNARGRVYKRSQYWERRETDPIGETCRVLWISLKKRAKESGEVLTTELERQVKFMIREMLEEEWGCPICDESFDLTPKVGPNRRSPTLDHVHGTETRIGNLALICHRCNRIKNNGTAEEHRRIADWMDSYA